MYSKITKQHLIAFLVLFSALVLIQYFSIDSYSTLSIKENCYSEGFSCCSQKNGNGARYFSLDDTCSESFSCFESCKSEKAISSSLNSITGNSIASVTGNSVSSFFSDLWKSLKFWEKDTVGALGGETCQSCISSGRAWCQIGTRSSCGTKSSDFQGRCKIENNGDYYDVPGTCPSIPIAVTCGVSNKPLTVKVTELDMNQLCSDSSKPQVAYDSTSRKWTWICDSFSCETYKSACSSIYNQNICIEDNDCVFQGSGTTGICIEKTAITSSTSCQVLTIASECNKKSEICEWSSTSLSCRPRTSQVTQCSQLITSTNCDSTTDALDCVWTGATTKCKEITSVVKEDCSNINVDCNRYYYCVKVGTSCKSADSITASTDCSQITPAKCDDNIVKDKCELAGTAPSQTCREKTTETASCGSSNAQTDVSGTCTASTYSESAFYTHFLSNVSNTTNGTSINFLYTSENQLTWASLYFWKNKVRDLDQDGNAKSYYAHPSTTDLADTRLGVPLQTNTKVYSYNVSLQVLKDNLRLFDEEYEKYLLVVLAHELLHNNLRGKWKNPKELHKYMKPILILSV